MKNRKSDSVGRSSRSARSTVAPSPAPGELVGDGADHEHCRARGGGLTVLLLCDLEAKRATTKETPSEFSLQVRRCARRTQLIAAARGAPAMVLAVLVLAVALVAYWLRAPRPSTEPRPMPPPGEPPMASFVFMTRTLSAASESSRTVVS